METLNIDRTDEQWRLVFEGWSDVELLRAYRDLSAQNPTLEGEPFLHHALWCLEGGLLGRMRSKAQWADGYTSALANAVEADYIDDEQYDDLYSEVLGL